MRAAAERLARLEAMQAGEDVAVASLAAMQATVHELHVHQIELEMQNGALQEAHKALEVSRKRYFELYDLAYASALTLISMSTVTSAPAGTDSTTQLEPPMMAPRPTTVSPPKMVAPA